MLFPFVIVAIGCSDHTSNVNSPFTYEGVELDTNQIVEISEQDLLGEWKLQSFIDLSDYSIYKNPEPEVFYIELEFKESNQIRGHTTNEFYGTYILEDKKIKMSISTITEINDLEWGRKFLNATSNTDYIFIEGSNLFIFFNQSSEVMVFTKN